MELTITVDKNKEAFILDVLKGFSFVKNVVRTDALHQKVKKDLLQALKEVKQMDEGKIKPISIDELINQL